MSTTGQAHNCCRVAAPAAFKAGGACSAPPPHSCCSRALSRPRTACGSTPGCSPLPTASAQAPPAATAAAGPMEALSGGMAGVAAARRAPPLLADRSAVNVAKHSSRSCKQQAQQQKGRRASAAAGMVQLKRQGMPVGAALAEFHTWQGKHNVGRYALLSVQRCHHALPAACLCFACISIHSPASRLHAPAHAAPLPPAASTPAATSCQLTRFDCWRPPVVPPPWQQSHLPATPAKVDRGWSTGGTVDWSW